MNITFFIGNGFDINLGLNTAYSSFYPYFIDKAQPDNMIREWIDGNELYWADLEERLGKELEKVSKDTLEQFYDDKEELDGLLLDYLESEQKRYSFDDKERIIKEFNRSMLEFYTEMPAENINSIKETMEKFKDDEFTYSYITFNYTNILDKIVGLYKDEKRVISSHQGYGSIRRNSIGRVVHIHGTIDEEMILGVNDESQIINDFLREEELFKDTFIKERMNRNIGQRKIEIVADVIKNSRIICVFGMSIGNTDKIWWEKLVDWLLGNEYNKLIIFSRVDDALLNKRFPARMIRSNEKIKRTIFEKGKGKWSEDYYSDIKKRILISYNANIFSLLKVKNNDKNEG